jgi:hypothetical protein
MDAVIAPGNATATNIPAVLSMAGAVIPILAHPFLPSSIGVFSCQALLVWQSILQFMFHVGNTIA